MKYRLMDILACPIDKRFPLRLIVMEEKTFPERKYTWPRKPFCEEYCSFRNVRVRELKNPQELPCEDCHKVEIVRGLLYCESCGRWYPIIDEIPRLLPDQLRNRGEDLAFLKSVEGELRERAPDIADKIIREGKPFNLSE